MSGRITDHHKTLPISALHPAIQAEGSRAGHPTIIVRTTGCTHRCYFGSGGWCDSWYTSIHPEKGCHSLQDVTNLYAQNPQIKDMILTGGAPTMHPALINELMHFAHQQKIHVTLETEGSHFVATDYPINLLSISPKFTNSVPPLGIRTPLGQVVDDKMRQQHDKYRLNLTAIRRMIDAHQDYHIKPVLDAELTALDELEDFLQQLQIPDDKVWVMPAGDSRETLIHSYGVVMNYARDRGWCFTPRPHIIAFDTERNV
ncbi:MAG: 7-carboxy-7-deazaguanine synthase QueE [Pseudomonadota bacterium]